MPALPLRLGVNVDHVATLRNARGGRNPDPVRAALLAIEAGADGITAHLREDRRHIRDEDMARLKAEISKPLNFEMAPTDDMMRISLATKPHAVCLVPERRQEVTTEGGLDVAEQRNPLTDTRQQLNDAGIEVSLFIAPEPKQIEAAALIGAQFIELHTGAFAEAFREAPQSTGELDRLRAGAEQAHCLGLKVNAGHGLNYSNLPLLHRVPHLVELNIGHSIISRAVFVGLRAAVEEMLALV